MRTQRVLTWVTVALVLAMPALAGLGLWLAKQRQQAAWVERGRASRREWAASLFRTAPARYGIAIGEPFPQLPLLPHRALVGAAAERSPTVVMLIHSVASLRRADEWRRLLDKTPGVNLLLVTEERADIFERNAPSLQHPRLTYARLLPEQFDRLQIITPGACYRLDRVGIVREAALFDDRTRSSTLRSFLAQAG